MARDVSRKDLKQDEFLEAGRDLTHWFEENWKMALRVGVGILVVIVVVAAFFALKQQRTQKALAVMELGSDHFKRAANAQFGDVDALASALEQFEKAEALAKGTPPGPLATYYRGVTLFRLGRREEAVSALETFAAQAKGDQPLDWAAHALLVELYATGNENERAIALLEGVTQAGSTYPQDQALIQLGRLHKSAGNTDAATQAWQRVVDEFPASLGAQRARELLGSS